MSGETTANRLDVLVVTVREQYYIPKFLEGLLGNKRIRTVGITTLPPALGTQSMPSFLWNLFGRFGPKVFAQHVRFYGTYRILDILNRVTGRGTPYSPQTLAKRHDIEYRHIRDVNDDDYVRYAESLSPDVIASVAATQKFESRLLKIPSEAAINIHSSMLPEYKGVSPSFWSLLHDEPETGITVHYIADEIDAGDIIRQRPVNIEKNDTLHTLNERVAKQGSELLVEALEEIWTGSVDATAMPEGGSYYSMPERGDVQQFLEQGNAFF